MNRYISYSYPFSSFFLSLGPDNCKFLDEFLGYPDPRPHRTFANIRYALYEYWLRQYSEKSYILILDFRDTFFQGDPFLTFGQFNSRKPKYELHLFAENYSVRNKCVIFSFHCMNILLIYTSISTPFIEELMQFAKLLKLL